MRKRSHLTLYKRCKRYTPKKPTSPIKSPSKKRQRILTPQHTPSRKVKNVHRTFVATKLQSPWNTHSPASQWIDIDTENNELLEEEYQQLILFKKELEKNGLWQNFKLFFDLVAKKLFPLDNIAMLLFLDTVNFFGCKSTTCMKYFPQTKRFWKSGYRLFHAKFLYYMGGPKNVGDGEHNQQGHIDPSTARINFAVPSIQVIEGFDLSDTATSMPKKMPAGVIEPILNSIEKSVQNKKFMLCADAKKVTAGIDKQGGDVDMFGFEDGETLTLRMNRLSHELQCFKEIEDNVTTDPDLTSPDIADKLRKCITIIGKRIQDARELKSRQEFGLNKFLALGGEKWRESKYIYVISAFHTSLFRLNDFLKSALLTIHRLCQATTMVSKPKCSLLEDLVVMKGHQDNMIFLNPDFKADILDPRHTLQRTPAWHEIRRLAPVTGSTIHDAIGLRGLQKQNKHIAKISNTTHDDLESFPDDVLTRMEYGTSNEGNALATLAAVVLPTLFPNCIYVEEGCHITLEVKDILMVISPDGSLREFQSDLKTTAHTEKIFAAIEVKCPYPKKNKVTLHYSLPQYYVCQCLAEMYALRTNRLIYLSWSPESSVVLDVSFDADLFALIHTLIKDTYDTDSPKRPANAQALLKKITLGISRFQTTHVKFLAEVPSAKMYSTNLPLTPASEPYIIPLPKSLPIENTCILSASEYIITAVKNGVQEIEIAYDLQRRRATEVMVWVLTHIDRDTKTDLPCSVPIAFGLKDYKLTSGAFRNATNYVITKCQEKGIQICSISTDGQWIQLMTRDSESKPLTILQLQKEVWSKSQKMSKVDICKYISGLNRVRSSNKNILECVEWERAYGKIYLQSKDLVARKVKMPDYEILKRLIISSKRTNSTDNEKDAITTDSQSTENISTTEWIPEQLLTVLQDSTDDSVNQAVRDIENNIGTNENDRNDRHTENRQLEYGSDVTDTTAQIDRSISNQTRDSHLDYMKGGKPTDSRSFECELDKMEVTTSSERSLENFITENTNERSTQYETSYNDQNAPLYDYENLAKSIVSYLNESNVTHITVDFLLSMFRSKQFTNLTQKMLDVLISATLVATGSREILRKSWNKTKKSELLKHLISGDKNPLPEKKKSRRNNIPPLSSLCERVIRSKKMPKSILNIVHASCTYDSEYENWKGRMSPVPLPDIFDLSGERSIPFWYSYPERINNDIIGKSIDCSHNLTHLRVRSCTTGIGNVSPEAWIKVSKTNETKLSPALVEDLIDKQSVPNARTNFSEEVEECMRKYGFEAAASLTRTIRNWYEACDAPGITAERRVRFLVEMRQFLLSNVSFSQFPPPTRYINKIPTVTFEGILLDIDTKIQLHWYAGSYNIRGVGSLAAETTVGVLQQLNPVSSVSIKARDVPSLVSNVVEVMTCKLDPNRGFHMRTAKRSGVYPTHEADNYSGKKDHATNVEENCLIIRDHPFDNSRRRNAKRRIRFGTVSGPTAPSRGALPVRQFHRKDESKILPTKRLGIEMLNI